MKSIRKSLKKKQQGPRRFSCIIMISDIYRLINIVRGGKVLPWLAVADTVTDVRGAITRRQVTWLSTFKLAIPTHHERGVDDAK